MVRFTILWSTFVLTIVLASGCHRTLLKPTGSVSVEGTRLDLNAALDTGDLEAAAVAQDRLAEHAVGDVGHWLAASARWLDVDHVQKANRALFRAAQLEPQSLRVYAQLLRVASRLRVAVDESIIFPDGFGESMALWRFWDGYAKSLLAKGQLVRAEAQANRAVLLSDGNQRAFRTLTMVKQTRIPLRIAATKAVRDARSQGLEEARVVRAIVLCLRAQTWDLGLQLLEAFLAQASTEAKLRMGRLYSKNGAQALAVKLLAKRLERAPSNFLTRYQLATVHRSMKNWKGVMDTLAPFQQGMPLWNRVLSMLAESASRLGRKEEAVRHFAAIRSAKPNDLRAVTQLIYALYRTAKHARMRSEIVFALSQWHRDPELNFLHALSIGETEGSSAGLQAMERLIETMPNHANALNYVAYALTEHPHQLQRAQTLIALALKAQPHNAAFIDTRGWVLFRQKKLDAAYADLRRAATLRPDHGEIQFHLAVVQSRLGQTVTAKKRLQLALFLAESEKERAKYEKDWTLINQKEEG